VTDSKPSKSARKREQHSLQELGETLIAFLRADDMRNKQLFARAERWRDRIVSNRGAALDKFDAEIGIPDAELRTLVGELEAACSEKAEKTVRRQIFRRIHEILVKIPQ
jgi:ribosomal 50S subunit-associated protein YjgA (DUF615 family)